MIFVDTNVFMYAVGRPHPLRREARAFFEEAIEGHLMLVTSAEVLQELLHAYLPVDRLDTLRRSLDLVDSSTGSVWPLESEDVLLGWRLQEEYSHLSARDLVHLACCRRRSVTEVKTFDRALAAAFRE